MNRKYFIITIVNDQGDKTQIQRDFSFIETEDSIKISYKKSCAEYNEAMKAHTSVLNVKEL